MYVVFGVTGNTGSVVARELLAQGRPVRVVVRDAAKGARFAALGAEVAVADVTDVAATTEALRGATAAYVLIPPAGAVPDVLVEGERVARSLHDAIVASGIPRVVLLSSIAAHLPAGTGPIVNLHRAEAILQEVPAAFTALRAPYFFENLGPAIEGAKAGTLHTFFDPSTRFDLVTTEDIGKVATRLLLETGPHARVVELHAREQASHEDVARALSTRLGRDVRVQRDPIDAMVPTLIGFGVPAQMANLYREMTEGLDRGHVRFEGGAALHVTADSTLAESVRALVPAPATAEARP